MPALPSLNRFDLVMKMCRFWLLSLLLLVGPGARADGMEALDRFLRTVHAAQGQFTQVVTSPPKAGESVGRRKHSSGEFAFARPNKFRFDYRKPFVQNLVSDGHHLWIYDADLDQLTQRRLAEVMQGTPAVLLAGAGLAELRKHFDLRNETPRDSAQWVRATPKLRDSALQSVVLGFDGASGDLRVLEVLDGLGQVSRTEFSGLRLNPALSQSLFVFRKP